MENSTSRFLFVHKSRNIEGYLVDLVLHKQDMPKKSSLLKNKNFIVYAARQIPSKTDMRYDVVFGSMSIDLFQQNL